MFLKDIRDFFFGIIRVGCVNGDMEERGVDLEKIWEVENNFGEDFDFFLIICVFVRGVLIYLI